MEKVSDYFGCFVFDDRVMKGNLSSEVYRSLKKTIDEGAKLDISVANAVAEAMKEWAVAHGATHYTHWFQPMTGITAEKHDSFISPSPDGRVIMEFSGKELIKGEPDASSFPSGGLRATFEARGYTAWDPTSYAFLKGKTLCIPTAFCSYAGEALDKKTPLLRSMEALNRQAMRILKLFGNEQVKCVRTCVGPEQEYFLIDEQMYRQRRDLMFTGRTLFGAKPPKGQQLDDHYFGVIPPRVEEFMEDLNQELWKLGILAKTEHNEVAPAQHELAPIYTTTNIATDHNQLTMEIMQKVAARHHLVCLLHEKPFAGVNGSGKHNNWSLSTDTGINLLSPGETPHENAQFLLFLCAVIQAVDDYQDLLRISVATAGNDLRLGANEAPPAIVSMFLGEELNGVLEALEQDKPYHGAKKTNMKLGAVVLPKFPKDSTDRNRTSPFAFTGNKFEFRMLGSSNSIACANIMLNTAVAESLRIFADRLEGAEDFEGELHDLLRETISAHKRIIFNGNGYDDSWVKEAVEERGLTNDPTTPDCVPRILEEKNMEMLTRHKVYSAPELHSRCEITLENYCKTVLIEANTMVDMARKEILPALQSYMLCLAKTAAAKKNLDAGIACSFERDTVTALSALADEIAEKTEELEGATEDAETKNDVYLQSRLLRDVVRPKMEQLRQVCDEAEKKTAKQYWPFPTYGELLFGVR
ncbi:glutamine synthetase III [Anaerotignum lactatifermentans]|uniref:Glutamine synthetase III n=1 Tax=Anaerotignum lactatifermentans TaxID=160404 RepID=A0ABS2G930_9FIRM|nr:glutamine synthetase III [Anaerotignum lactatifermentans]MBM6829011.1 glutamine synthetase III [Anaerotignum lactatifermentans]MBM6877382.1 glutamine synthetase III [Anaerotignum lactatifermentans]MBM6950752.1 glutamine synthetase III [Anaerotignum lactatifermentans]